MRQLDSDNGIGLIEKKRRGLGKPDIIYVKNFASVPDEKEEKVHFALFGGRKCVLERSLCGA